MKKQVFILEVNDTQNQSWQGSLRWVERHKQESFRSMLEMLRLIDSAMNGEAEDLAEQRVAGE